MIGRDGGGLYNRPKCRTQPIPYYEVCMSYARPGAWHVVTEFGVADALDDTPRSATRVGKRVTGADPDSLVAVGLLGGIWIFSARRMGSYVHTPASPTVASGPSPVDAPPTIRLIERIPVLADLRATEPLNRNGRTYSPESDSRRAMGILQQGTPN